MGALGILINLLAGIFVFISTWSTSKLSGRIMFCILGGFASLASPRLANDLRYHYIRKFQGQILAVWIVAKNLPNSHLNFAVEFWVDFSSCFYQGNRSPQKKQSSPRNSFGKFPTEFCRSLLVENSGGILTCKDFMCITSKSSRGINFIILAFRMVFL